jgi:ribosomal-protein-alanine N-acetyltransferase
MILFETERLLVRRFVSSDTDFFFLLNGDARVVHYIRPAKTRAESDSFLDENIGLYCNNNPVGRYAVFERHSGDFAGTFSFLHLADTGHFHIGYALLPHAWGKGFATELVAAGTPWFFNHTDKTALSAITHPDNLLSQKVLLKSGYELRGEVAEQGKTLQLFVIDRP